MQAISLDVVIISFNLDERYLSPILQLPVPDGADLHWILVADNPAIQVPLAVHELAAMPDSRITILINEKNCWASQSRNRGIEAGKGDWILFLDDDILPNSDLLKEYVQAIRTAPDKIGFIGYVGFPPAGTPLLKAMELAGPVPVFTQAAYRGDAPWGVAASLLVNRERMGDIRFRDEYRKAGGGEDVDFCVRLRNRNGKNLKTVATARVTHPWWNGGKINMERLYRYSSGSAMLVKHFPRNLHYDFPNTTDSFLLTLLATPLVLLAGLAWWKIICFIVGLVLLEFILLRLKYPAISMAVSWHIFRIQRVFEAGYLFPMLRRGRFDAFIHKPDNTFSGKTQYFRTNRWKIIKLTVTIGLVVLIVFL